jgi:hypothetical protein
VLVGLGGNTWHEKSLLEKERFREVEAKVTVAKKSHETH